MKNKKLMYVLILALFFLMEDLGRCNDDFAGKIFSVFSGSISGYCFDDINKNGEMDLNEKGLLGRTVSLKKINFLTLGLDEIATVATIDNGSFAFDGLKKGVYIVEENTGEGTVRTTTNKFLVFIGRFQKSFTGNFGIFLEIFPLPTAGIEADPVAIKKGLSSTLSWSSANATSVSLDQGIGETDLSGLINVTPLETTTYSLTASGKGGIITDSVTVFVTTDPLPPPLPEEEKPTASLTVSSPQVQAGGEITLTWTSTNALEAALNNGIGIVELNGTKKVIVNGTTTYVFTVLGLDGSIAKASATVTVPGNDNTGTTTIITTTTTTITTTPTTTTTEVPTAILLTSFEAEPGNQSVTLVWKTESEFDNYGFNLYRSEKEDGDFAKINDTLIESQGSATKGATYTYINGEVKSGHIYYYKLEQIDLSGKSIFHGPVYAIPGRF